MRIHSRCRRTTLALPWLLNGSLAAAKRREVREHLIHCPQCRAELARSRETLAAFNAGRTRTSSLPAASRPRASRFAARARELRHLSWAAAMVAVVLSALGGAWLAGTRATTVARQDRPEPTRIAGGAGVAGAQGKVTFSTSFENGSLGSSAASPAKISSADFENGELEWK